MVILRLENWIFIYCAMFDGASTPDSSVSLHILLENLFDVNDKMAVRQSSVS